MKKLLVILISLLFVIGCGKKEEKKQKEPTEAQKQEEKVKQKKSSLTVISFQAPKDKEYGYKLAQAAWDTLSGLENIKMVTANELIDSLTTDQDYLKVETSKLLRKWGNRLGIRYIVTGQIISPEDGKYKARIIIVDSQFEYPIVKSVEGKKDELISLAALNIKDVIENIKAARQEVALKMIQVRWQEKRNALVGKPAPEFKLTSLDGNSISSNELKGEVTVFHFFSLDCEYCEEELEWMKQFNRKEDVQVIGINLDSDLKDSVETYVKKHRIDYPVVIAGVEDSTFLDNYYADVTPQTIIIDKRAVIREFMIGFNEGMKNKFARLIENLLAKK